MIASVSSPTAVPWRRTLAREVRRGLVGVVLAALALAGLAAVVDDSAVARGWWAVFGFSVAIAGAMGWHTCGRFAIARRALRDGEAPDPQLLGEDVDPDAGPPSAAVARRTFAARARSRASVAVLMLLLALGYGWLVAELRDLPTASIPAVAAAFVVALASIDALWTAALWLAATVLERRAGATLVTAGGGSLRVLRRAA